MPVVALALPYVISERDPGFRLAAIVLLVAIILVVITAGGLGNRQIRELLEEVAKPAQTWRPYGKRPE